MSEPETIVHALATVRRPELLDAALLVFRTVRDGFPTASLNVWGNALPAREQWIVGNACRAVGAGFTNLRPTVHDRWLEELVQESVRPFWVLDTDVCLWENVEGFAKEWKANGVEFAGRWEPAFDEESTGSLHVERLHTALMWIDPSRVRAAIRTRMAQIPAPWGHKADFTFLRQSFVPLRSGRTLFYDTMAGLWQAGIGTPFTKAQDAAFDHLHCGTYVDLIGPALSTNLAATHQAIYRDHKLARGMLAGQMEYYAQRAPGNAARKGRKERKGGK